MRHIRVADRSYSVVGSEDDSYYVAAQDHVNGFSDWIPRLQSLERGTVILDVGANIGLSCIVMATYAPQCRVIGFEPSPENFRFLLENVRESRLENIEVINAAVSDQRRTLRFHSSESGDWSGAWAHVVTESHINPEADATDVKSVTLDDFRDEPISFVKIDVEGHEPEVIAGGTIALIKWSPLICLEFNPWTLNAYGGHSPAAFAKALFDHFEVEGMMNASGLLNSTICHGTQADLFLKPKVGATVPSLEEMSFPAAALIELARLRKATVGTLLS